VSNVALLSLLLILLHYRTPFVGCSRVFLCSAILKFLSRLILLFLVILCTYVKLLLSAVCSCSLFTSGLLPYFVFYCRFSTKFNMAINRASDVIAPVLTEISNTSLQSWDLPETKVSPGFPRLNKLTLDAEDANLYRPISNLLFASNFVERVVATRFAAHAERHKLFPSNQSTYRQHHNTETAVVSVRNDIIRAIGRGEVTAPVLLDLSASFDTMDHCVLLDVLYHWFTGKVYHY